MTAPNASYANKHVDFTQCSLASPFVNNRADVQSVISDIRSVVSQVDIYENIFSPVLTGELTIQDDVGLSSLVPLIGMESVLLKFNITDPTGVVRHYGNSSPLVFSVYRESNRSPRNQGTESYKLGMVSSELFSLSESRISKAYPEIPGQSARVETIIQDLIASTKTKKSFTDIETTKSPINVVIPYLRPIDVIKLLTLQGQSDTSETNYTFYETLRGFHFSSIRRMIERGQTSVIPKISMRLAGLSGAKSVVDDITADAIEVVSGFDFLYQLSHGAFASVTTGVDVLSGKYRQTISSSNDDATKAKTLTNGRGAFPMYPFELGRIANPTAKMFLVPTTSISAADTSITSKDPTVRDNFIEHTIDGRNRELISLQSKCVRVRVSGVPELHAGSLVDIVVPIPSNNNKFVQSRVDIASGRYLIVSAKHTLINTGAGQFLYETVFEACSDSHGK